MSGPDQGTRARVKLKPYGAWTAHTERLAALQASGYGVTVSEPLSLPETPMSEDIRSAMIAAAEYRAFAWRPMPSGAGHDAMVLSKIAPVGLVFVPSRDGVSHTPEEWTDYDQLARGVEVNFRATRALTI